MWRSLLDWFRRPAPPEDRSVALAAEVQALSLALQEAERRAAVLAEDVARHRRAEAGRVAMGVDAAIAPWLEEAATPVAQLLTQAHLLEAEGKPLRAQDVLAVARRLVAALEGLGLVVDGRVGEVSGYDATRHEPLGGEAIAPGAPVRVRLVGVRHGERMLRRAAVELEGGPHAG